MSEYVDPKTGEVRAFCSDNGGFATWQEFLDKMKVRGLTPDGASQIPDSTPMEPPVGYVQPPDLMEQMRQMVRSELLRRAADAEGFESEEEANDFELGPDDEVDEFGRALTPYEEAELEGPPEAPPPAEPAEQGPRGVPGVAGAASAPPASVAPEAPKSPVPSS